MCCNDVFVIYNSLLLYHTIAPFVKKLAGTILHRIFMDFSHTFVCFILTLRKMKDWIQFEFFLHFVMTFLPQKAPMRPQRTPNIVPESTSVG